MSSSGIVYLGLGSNLGDRESNIEKALELLASQGDIIIDAVSSLGEFPAVESCEGQEPFLNGVACINSELQPLDLLHRLQVIERKLGRKSKEDGSARTIDIDILAYKEPVVFSGKSLVIPHPRMHLRLFVLQPMSELNQSWIHPKLKLSVADMIAALESDANSPSLESSPQQA